MGLPDHRMALQLAKFRLEGCRREAETRRLLREAGLTHPGGLSSQIRSLFSGLGHLLVSLSRRLERYEVVAKHHLADE